MLLRLVFSVTPQLWLGKPVKTPYFGRAIRIYGSAMCRIYLIVLATFRAVCETRYAGPIECALRARPEKCLFFQARTD